MSYCLGKTTAAGAATTGTFTIGFFAGLPAFLGATIVDETAGLSATTGAGAATGAATTGTFFADAGLPAFFWTGTAGEGDETAATGLLVDAGLPAFLGATIAAVDTGVVTAATTLLAFN